MPFSVQVKFLKAIDELATTVIVLSLVTLTNKLQAKCAKSA